MTEALRTVYLHGALGRKFGWKHRLAVSTPSEVIAAMSANRKGFRQFFWREEAAYTFVRGSTLRTGTPVGLVELPMLLGKDDFHIVPVTQGAGGGVGKTIGKIGIGVAMVAAAVFSFGAAIPAEAAGVGAAVAAGEAATAAAGTAAAVGFAADVGGLGLITAGQLGAMGGMMILGGVSQLITPTPQASPAGGTYAAMESPAARSSFLYRGPANTMEQGGPVPVIYGRMLVGSTLMSASLQNDEVNITT